MARRIFLMILLQVSVIFVMKIKMKARIIGLHFKKTKTRIMVIQKTKIE